MSAAPGDVERVAAEAWQELVERDDRTSPAEYPEMALITREELAEFIAEAVALEARERVIAVTMMREASAQRCRDLQAFGDAHEGNGNSKAWARAAESLATQIESLPLTTEPATEHSWDKWAEEIGATVRQISEENRTLKDELETARSTINKLAARNAQLRSGLTKFAHMDSRSDVKVGDIADARRIVEQEPAR